ncbi:MAG TPA: CoA activase, partial [Sutterella sp.]|nr:CoA activase [Sutterella sp.]
MALYGGLDLGSTTGKLMLIDENRKILGWSIVPSQGGPEKTAAAARAKAFEAAGLSEDTKIDYLIATGYGRNNFKSKDEDISEISCHELGAHTLQPQARTIVDIGG